MNLICVGNKLCLFIVSYSFIIELGLILLASDMTTKQYWVPDPLLICFCSTYSPSLWLAQAQFVAAPSPVFLSRYYNITAANSFSLALSSRAHAQDS